MNWKQSRRTENKGLPRFSFQSWQRHAHAGELGFRDFSSLFLVKENRRQLGNSACCISRIKVSLTTGGWAIGTKEWAWYEFKSRSTQRAWDRDCPDIRTVCARSFLSICCGRSFWFVGPTWSKKRSLGRFRSFRGVHGRGNVSLPQFVGGVVCMGSYRRGDTLWNIAHRGLQNTKGLRPLRTSPFVICNRHVHRSRHQGAIRLFGLLGGLCSILIGILGAGSIHVGQASEPIAKLSGRYVITTVTSIKSLIDFLQAM